MKQIGTVDFSDKEAVMRVIDRAERESVNLSYEVITTVTAEGKV